MPTPPATITLTPASAPGAPGTITLSGLWPGFLLSGVTGTGAASINGNYTLLGTEGVGGERTFAHANGLSTVEDVGGGSWEISLSGVGQFSSNADAEFPWIVDGWTATDAATGAPEFIQLEVAPGTVALSAASGPGAPSTITRSAGSAPGAPSTITLSAASQPSAPGVISL